MQAFWLTIVYLHPCDTHMNSLAVENNQIMFQS